MNLPAIKGIIRRRILLNYRVAPELARRVLPGNFRPKLVDGHAIAGICLIRLEKVRPRGLPAFVGISSENSAHRIAVEWEDGGGRSCEGVFVPRRDTDSRLVSLAGGRIFPGVQHHSRFEIRDSGGRIGFKVRSAGGASSLVEMEAEETEDFPASSVFGSLADSSRFFEAGSIGYSSRPESCVMDGISLKVPVWHVSPLSIRKVKSSYFDDTSIFPAESIHFDHALLMRDIEHEWHPEPVMRASDGRSGMAWRAGHVWQCGQVDCKKSAAARAVADFSKRMTEVVSASVAWLLTCGLQGMVFRISEHA